MHQLALLMHRLAPLLHWLAPLLDEALQKLTCLNLHGVEAIAPHESSAFFPKLHFSCIDLES